MKNYDKSGRKTETFFEIAAKKKKEIILDIVSKDNNRKIISGFRKKNHIPKEGLGPGYGYKIAHLVEYSRGDSVGNLDGIGQLADEIVLKENFKTERKKQEMSTLIQFYIVFGEQGLEMHLHDSNDIIFGYNIGGKENYYGIDSSVPMVKISEEFPLVIRFRPSTNQRDLITFVRDTYKSYILDRKKMFPGDRKQIRVKTRRPIYQLIYDNRDKESGEIFDLVKKRFDEDTAKKYAGYDNIRAIINLEKKRRGNGK